MSEQLDTQSEYRRGELVYVETKTFGVIRATVAGYYPNAKEPYVNLWMIDGFPGASYTTSPDKVHKAAG